MFKHTLLRGTGKVVTGINGYTPMKVLSYRPPDKNSPQEKKHKMWKRNILKKTGNLIEKITRK